MSHDDAYYEGLLMKAVDGLLNDEESRTLDAWLAEDPTRARELESFRRIKETTDQMTQRLMNDVKIEPFRESPAHRSVSWTAFAWILGGLAIAMGWAAIEFLKDPEVPGAIRFGLFVAAGGALALFVRVLWTRVRSMGRDPYEEIDR